jgi:hypothetical protein
MALSIPSSQIKDAVIRELGEGAVDLTADIERYRKIVLREIARFHHWHWLESVPITLTTETDASYIIIPDYVNQIKNIYQSGGAEEMELISPQEYSRLAALNSGTQDYPSKYFMQDKRIYFWPPITVNSSVTVIASISGEQLDDNSTSGINGVGTVIPVSFSGILEHGILSYLDDVSNKAKWMTLTYDKLQQARMEDVKNHGHQIKATLDKNIDGFRYYYNS